MKLLKCKYRIKCEMGACGNVAKYSIFPSRTGSQSTLHVCENCLEELTDLFMKEKVAKKEKAEKKDKVKKKDKGAKDEKE